MASSQMRTDETEGDNHVCYATSITRDEVDADRESTGAEGGSMICDRSHQYARRSCIEQSCLRLH